jgi:transposase-like protein
MRQLSFKRHRFPPNIIRHSIWLYARFTLSFRDVEEMLAERGLDVSYETVRGAVRLMRTNLQKCSLSRASGGKLTPFSQCS